MASAESGEDKPHAVCIPCPAQGHINSILRFAKLLHLKGFHITFVHTDTTYNKIIASSGSSSLDGVAGFHFETIPDNPPDPAGESNSEFFIGFSNPLRELLRRLNDSGGPNVTCIVYDTFLSFIVDIAAEFGVPGLSFCPVSACAFWGFFYLKELIERGILPLKSENDLTNGYLDTPVGWIPGMKNMRIRDFASSIRTGIPTDRLLNFLKDQAQNSLKATAIVIHTFEELEAPVLDAMSSTLPPVYAVGPLNQMCHQIPNKQLKTIGSTMWRNDFSCMEWLEGKSAGLGSLREFWEHNSVDAKPIDRVCVGIG